MTLGGDGEDGTAQAAETAGAAVIAGDTLQEWCRTTAGSIGSCYAYNAGITAIRVLFFSGTPPAHTGTPIKGPRGEIRPTPQRTPSSPPVTP